MLHYRETILISLLKSAYCGDVGLMGRWQQLDLALEARKPFRIAAENVRQELEGNLAIHGSAVSRETSPIPPCPGLPAIR